MKKTSNIILMLGAIASLIGCAVSFYIHYSAEASDGFTPNAIIASLYIGGIWYILTFIFCLIALKNSSKGMYIAGLIVATIGLYQTYGVSLIALIGFAMKYSDYCKERRIRDQEIESLPDEERYVAINNDKDYKYRHIDYKLYVKSYRWCYILSSILSIIYLGLYIYGFVLLTKHIMDSSGGYGIFLLILFGIFYFALAAIGFFYIILGFIASISVIFYPSRQLLKFNQIYGILSLTIFNSYASGCILTDIEKQISLNQ